ncbi:MAG: hypothetical protein WAW37_09965 [Syntrophobacteraceae bacterium]
MDSKGATYLRMKRFRLRGLPDMDPFAFVIGHGRCYPALGGHTHADNLAVVFDPPGKGPRQVFNGFIHGPQTPLPENDLLNAVGQCLPLVSG